MVVVIAGRRQRSRTIVQISPSGPARLGSVCSGSWVDKEWDEKLNEWEKKYIYAICLLLHDSSHFLRHKIKRARNWAERARNLIQITIDDFRPFISFPAFYDLFLLQIELLLLKSFNALLIHYIDIDPFEYRQPSHVSPSCIKSRPSYSFAWSSQSPNASSVLKEDMENGMSDI